MKTQLGRKAGLKKCLFVEAFRDPILPGFVFSWNRRKLGNQIATTSEEPRVAGHVIMLPEILQADSRPNCGG